MTNNKKKIKLAHMICTLGVGGAERHVVDLTNQLQSEIFDKHLIVLRNVKDELTNLLGVNIKYYSLGLRRRYMPAAISRLFRYLRQSEIDILHCHMFDANELGVLVRSISSEPAIVTTDHGIPANQSLYRYLMERFMINRIASLRVAVAPHIRDFLVRRQKTDRAKVITIPNGTLVPDYTLDTLKAPRIIGSMGRLAEVKDYPTLFRAIKIVTDRGYDVELSVAGTGNQKKELENLIQELHLTQVIKLLGLKDPDEFFRNIDMFVMSSIREGTPLVLLEAMARGIPVVATSVGGIPNIVTNRKNGLLVPTRDPAALASNIIKLISNVKVRTKLGTNARKQIVNHYSMPSIASEYTRIYRKLFKRKER